MLSTPLEVLEVECVHFFKKFVLGYFRHLVIIEYFRLKIEYLRFAFGAAI